MGEECALLERELIPSLSGVGDSFKTIWQLKPTQAKSAIRRTKKIKFLGRL